MNDASTQNPEAGELERELLKIISIQKERERELLERQKERERELLERQNELERELLERQNELAERERELERKLLENLRIQTLEAKERERELERKLLENLRIQTLEAKERERELLKRQNELERELLEQVNKYEIVPACLSAPSSLANVCSRGAVLSLPSRLRENRISWGRRAQHHQHIPVELMIKEFGEFKDFCSLGEIRHSAALKQGSIGKIYPALVQLVLTMNKFYDSEVERSTAVAQCLENLLNSNEIWNCPFDTIKVKDNSGSIPDWSIESNNGRPPCFMAEVKNEQGTTNCNAFIEVMSYYARACDLQIAKSNPIKRHVNPCILLTLQGNLLEIGGACSLFLRTDGSDTKLELVHIVDDLIDPIATTLPLKSLLERLSVVIVALRAVILDAQNHVHTCNCPYSLKSIPGLARFGNKLAWMSKSEKRVWKFAKTYSQEAHHCAHELGIAPAIYSITQLPGNWMLVEMALVSGCLSGFQDNSLDKHDEQFLAGIAQFHANGFVHGDLRPQNLLYSSTGYSIIDFDWAGKTGEACYPTDMNHINIQWPDGAEPTNEITIDHDRFWLRSMGFYN